jgi:hypothetical protein
LILENKLADGHSREESQMILNHKYAFEFVLSHFSSACSSVAIARLVEFIGAFDFILKQF